MLSEGNGVLREAPELQVGWEQWKSQWGQQSAVLAPSQQMGQGCE